MIYIPNKKSKWITDLRIFKWLREDWCNLSFTGREDILRDKENPRIFAFHPHGVHCVAATLMCTESTLDHIRVACTYFLFWVPIIKEFCAWGNAFSCDKDSINQTLALGKSIIIYPGAINEVPGATYLREAEFKMLPGEDEKYYVYLRRTGFIQLAMDRGIDIVPCWVDGEYDLFDVYHPFPSVQRWCHKIFKYPWPIVSIGWKWIPFVPKKKKITIWIGDPISTKDSDRSLDFYSELYARKITELALKVKESK